jgi:predicted metalloprotease
VREGLRVLRRWVALLVSAAVVAAVSGAGVGAALADRPAKSRPYDKDLKTAIADIQDFWATEMPAVYGIPYERIPNSKIHSYTAGTNMKSITECARATNKTYEDFKDNAFFCRLDGTVNYDNGQLFPRLYKKFGTAFTLAQVLAHEWGHVIQSETGTQFPATVLSEQQADCFAGAWVASVQSGGSTKLDLAPGDLDRGLAGMLEFRDPPGGDPTQKGAHGSGFDRVNAFQQGAEGGAARCAQFTDNPPTIVELPFTSAEDVLQGGNLPFRQVLPTTKEDLDLYWQQFTFGGAPYKSVSDVISYNPKDKKSLPKCPSLNFKASDYKDSIFYCQDEDFVAYDRDLIRGVYNEIGDFGVATLVGNSWASAMQSRLGITGESKEVGLQADCFTGAWVGSVPVDQEATVQARGLPETRQASFSLSPGDLDEVVQSFLVFGDPAEAKESTRGTSFERMEAFRLGFFQDEQACLSLAGA